MKVATPLNASEVNVARRGEEQGAIQEIEVVVPDGRFESRFSRSKGDGGLLVWLSWVAKMCSVIPD